MNLGEEKLFIKFTSRILNIFGAIILFVNCQVVRSQELSVQGANNVLSYKINSDSIYRAYFPSNVLGFPDTAARADVPTISPNQILPLGIGGEIVLEFVGGVILNKPGNDFVVYENAFHYSLGKNIRTYIEPAEISVSLDGYTFYAFKFDSLSLKGCAGVTPTSGEKFYSDIQKSGGDWFDLEQLGLDSIRFIKIKDVSVIIKNNSHPLYDATVNGFDLDAVVTINFLSKTNSVNMDSGSSKNFHTIQLTEVGNISDDKKMFKMWWEF